MRSIDVGGMQGRGNPQASRYHHEAAEVARIKSSTPLQITREDDEPRSLLASPWLYLLAPLSFAASVGFLSALYYIAKSRGWLA